MAERLALIGAGSIGKRHLRTVADTDAADIVAIADPSPAAAELAERSGIPHFADPREMLRGVAPTGAIVATPTEMHLEPSLAALEAGCHLLIEKPIASTVEEAEQISAVATANNREVLVGHHRRYYPNVQRARELIRSGDLGQLLAVSGQWIVRKPDQYYEAPWRKRWQAGPVLTNLIHDIDYLRYIVGDVVSVTAETGNPVQAFEKEDVAAFVLRFANGALGAFVLSDQADSPWGWEFATGENPAYPRSGQNCIRFAGTKGALDFPNLCLWSSEQETGDWTIPKLPRPMPMELGDAFAGQIAHFVDVIHGSAKPKITVADATETLKVTLAVLESGRSGSRVRV